MSSDHAGYLLAYFSGRDGSDAEQVRFALTEGVDALRWKSINAGEPVLRSARGTGGARDPFVVRTDDGFAMMATDLHTWPDQDWQSAVRRGSRSILVWTSPDLVRWSDAALVELAPSEAGNAWAPKAFWSVEKRLWRVFWSSALYDHDDDRSTATHQRIMSSETRDFRTFTPAVVALDRGTSAIDATFLRTDAGWHRFSVDHQEALGAGPQASAITIDRGETVDGPFETIASGVGLPALERGEGPAVVADPTGAVWLLIDEFGGRGYQLFESDGRLDRWSHRPDAVLPPGARHGSMISITARERDRLVAHTMW